jgi:hypothetical protein
MECIESVYAACDHAGFPVAVHIIPGINGHIGEARAAGYRLGNHPYATYVDDDDWVMTNAFEQMIKAIWSGVPAIFSPEKTIQNGQIRSGEDHHHLIAYRRDVLIDHTPFVVCGDLKQMKHAEMYPGTVTLQVPTYIHRLYQSAGRVLRRQHHDELRACRG